MEFKDRLKYYRERAGYKTAKDFANKLGLPYPTYVAYENAGREPKYEVLIKISKLLNVTIDELLGNSPDRIQWIKGILENNGFSIYVITDYDLNIILHNGPYLYPMPGPFFRVVNLGNDKLGDMESFVFTTGELECIFASKENMDQQNKHEKYLQIFRERQTKKISAIMYKIYTMPEYNSLRDSFLGVNPQFFDLWFSDFEFYDSKRKHLQKGIDNI